MRLVKCYIENFGMYREREFGFERGLNCFLSENGTGKTTLTVFIKAMLYGFGDNRKASITDNERKKYLPWQGGLYGGSLTFEASGRTYIVERSFGARPADDTFALHDAKSGREVTDYTENLGEELFGIDRDGFIRTVFLSERSIQGRVNPSVASRLSDLVGADGDVGDYDSAIKRLEERRKFYQKRGKSGEIPRIQAQIAECKRELGELERIAEANTELELRIREKEKELTECVNRKSDLSRRLDGIRAQKERRSLDGMYRGMLDEIETERGRLLALQRFFGGEPPTVAEINAARDAYRDGERLFREATADGLNSEYAELAEKFSAGTDFAELDRMERAARALAEDEERINAIKEATDERSVEMHRLFPGEAPTVREIEENIKKSKHRAGAGSAGLIILGALAAIGGALTGYLLNSLLYAVCVLGAVLFLSGICLCSRALRGTRREIGAFIARYSPSRSKEDITAALYGIQSDLAQYEKLCRERDAELSELTERIAESKKEVLGFIDRFPRTDATPLEAILLIREDYSKYYSMSMAEEKSARSRISNINLAEQLLRVGRDFIAKYPTVTDSPFDEIRDKADEYHALSARLLRLERDCARFKEEHGINEDAVGFDPDEECRLLAEAEELDTQLGRLRRELTILEREYNENLTECERADEIRAREEQLSETLARYEKNLRIVLMTEELLSVARDNITAKYIGKTKERFLYYQQLISGEAGEFGVDNEFVITKTERGGARSEESFSRGTRELLSLAMRLALTDSLYEGELPFIILDDPLISLDDGRCERAKAMIKAIARERQILYFTCAKSREIK